MTKAERDAWVAALRSGKYKQGRGYLRTNKGFCCLGVFCDLRNPEGWVHDASEIWRHQGGMLYAMGYFSTPVDDARASTVANMNDEGKPFAEIADWIEANWPVED